MCIPKEKYHMHFKNPDPLSWYWAYLGIAEKLLNTKYNKHHMTQGDYKVISILIYFVCMDNIYIYSYIGLA